MSVGLSSSQRIYLVMIRQVLAAWSKWGWIDASWLLAIMGMESGYQPLVINNTGRQDGLMQVIPPTAQAMAAKYGIPAGPQTDPMTSILSGTAYFDASARAIIAHRGVLSLPLWDVVQAYNEGYGAVEAGRTDQAYLTKFQVQLPVIQAQMNATSMLTKGLPMNFRAAYDIVPFTARLADEAVASAAYQDIEDRLRRIEEHPALSIPPLKQ